MEIQKLTKTSRAPQAKAAKELAEVRSRLQYDIEENGDSENSTLSKLAAAFCRDDKSKEKLQKYVFFFRSFFIFCVVFDFCGLYSFFLFVLAAFCTKIKIFCKSYIKLHLNTAQPSIVSVWL